MSKEGHLERTANEPRDAALHAVAIKRIDQINADIRIFRLKIPEGGPDIRFLPGQWVDLFCPGIPRVGGFTITSPPSAAAAAAAITYPREEQPRYIELAVQRAPENPAAWLWGEVAALLGTELRVRTGGSFVYPPPELAVVPPRRQQQQPKQLLRRLVFIAGGVGVNPFVSMLSHLAQEQQRQRQQVGDATTAPPCEVRFLYSVKEPPGGTRDAGRILFVGRLAALFEEDMLRGELRLFLTGGGGGDDDETEGVVSCGDGVDVPFRRRRIALADLAEAVGQDRASAAVYVCGVPTMTDEFVAHLTSPTGLGLESRRVLYEKWW